LATCSIIKDAGNVQEAGFFNPVSFLCLPSEAGKPGLLKEANDGWQGQDRNAVSP